MTEHCRDCCCAQSWKALGITKYTGRSIPEHIQRLRRAHDDLLAIAKITALKCTRCCGDGRVLVTINAGVEEFDDCSACADIRAVIAKAEGTE